MLVSCFLALALVFQPPVEQPDPEELERLREEAAETDAQRRAQLAEAERIAREVADLQARLVEAGDRARAREQTAEAARLRLIEVEGDEARLLERLRAERDSLAQVLAALQRLERANPPALAVSPEDAAEAARAAGLLADLAPRLEARAQAYRESLDELAALRATLTRSREEAEAADAALEAARREIEDLIADRREAERAARSEAESLSRRAREIGARAETLEELLVEIRRFARDEPRLNPRRADAAPAPGVSAPSVPIPRLAPGRDGALRQAVARTDPPPTLRFADVRGQLRPPAPGVLLSPAGSAGPDGAPRDGVVIGTTPGAQVTAPFDGVIVYADELPGYAYGLLIQTADAYTLVLGGLSVLYVTEGQSVLTGEPVGAMPEDGSQPAQLYFEIRRSTNQPANPEDWLGRDLRRG